MQVSKLQLRSPSSPSSITPTSVSLGTVRFTQENDSELIHERFLHTFTNLHASMNALDRMKRLVGLEGGSSRQQTPAALGTSSENGPPAVKITNPIRNGANSLEQRLLVEETPLALDLALTTFDSDFNPSEYREHCDRPLHSSAQPNQPLYQPLLDDPPAIGHDAEPPSLFDSCAAIIEGAGSSSSSKAPYTRGHRRRSTHVTRRDLEKFQKEVLGVDNRPAWYDEENGSSLPINPYDPQLAELNLAFERADMSMNSGAGGMAGGNNPGPNTYSNYTENSPTPNMGSMQRQSPNPAYPHPAPQVNGAGAGVGGMGAAMNASMSMNAGHQMDLHHLYEMVMELSEVLKNNREVTKNIVTSAEEIMVRFDYNRGDRKVELTLDVETWQFRGCKRRYAAGQRRDLRYVFEVRFTCLKPIQLTLVQ